MAHTPKKRLNKGSAEGRSPYAGSVRVPLPHFLSFSPGEMVVT